MKKNGQFVSLCSLLLMCAAGAASASELVYQFRSPTFGGNPLNASAIQAERSDNKEQEDTTTSTQDSIADLVRRSVSFQLANNINAAIFGDNALQTGTSLLGDGSSISWNRNGNLVTVTFTGIDGSTTSFIVPD